MWRREPDASPKTLDCGIVEKLLELTEAKGKSWVKRSIARVYDVYECRKNTWIVRGRKKLGDAEHLYVVKYDEGRGSLICTCNQPYKPYFKSRRHTCSHIGACLFYHLFF
ncbi:MAG: hypothetical protein QW701_02855 [Candidatus Nezhaarchaeales archaeon]